MRNRWIALALTAALCSCSLSGRASAAPDDNAIRDEVRAYLHSDGFDAIELVVDRGVVTMTGHLSTTTFREKAVSDAERVAGVRSVVDRIEVP